MNIEEFLELFNKDKLNFLLKCDNKDLKTWINYERDDGNKYSIAEKNTYISGLKQKINYILENGKELEDHPDYLYFKNKYHQSPCGRWYVDNDKKSLQTDQREICDFMFYNNEECPCYDIDIKNCVPSILLYLAKKNNISCATLQNYCENREEVMNEHNFSKNRLITLINLDEPKIKKDESYLTLLVKEITKIKKKLITIYTDKKYQGKPDSNNPMSSKVSYIVYHQEAEIVNTARENDDKVSILKFDGFITYTNDPEKLLSTINDKLKDKYLNCIEFSIKDFTPTDKLLGAYNEDEDDEDTAPCYKKIKPEFEKNFSWVSDGGHYVRYNHKINEWEVVSKETWETANGIYRYSKGDGKIHSVRSRWLVDSNRTIFDNICFYPYNKYDPEAVKIYNENYPNCINRFSGFNAIKLNDGEYTQEEMDKVISIFWGFIYKLVGQDEELVNHFKNFFSHLVKYPHDICEIVHILKGLQGSGKDTLVNFLTNMLGEKYVYSTANPEDIFGSFNDSLKNKLLLIFNEVDGRDTQKNQNKLKDIATAKNNNIKEKFKNNVKEDNCVRVFLFSNNMKPYMSSTDDRRGVIIKTGYKHIGKIEIFEEFNKICIDNKRNINLIYTWLLNYDISGYIPRWDKPITEEEIKMKMNSVCPVKFFIYKIWDNKDELSKYDFHQLKNKNIVAITPNAIKAQIEKFVERRQLPLNKESYNHKSIKDKLLHDFCGVSRTDRTTYKSIDDGDRKHNYFLFDYDEVKEWITIAMNKYTKGVDAINKKYSEEELNEIDKNINTGIFNNDFIDNDDEDDGDQEIIVDVEEEEEEDEPIDQEKVIKMIPKLKKKKKKTKETGKTINFD